MGTILDSTVLEVFEDSFRHLLILSCPKFTPLVLLRGLPFPPWAPTSSVPHMPPCSHPSSSCFGPYPSCPWAPHLLPLAGKAPPTSSASPSRSAAGTPLAPAELGMKALRYHDQCTILILFRILPFCPRFGLTEEGRPQAGSHPELALAESWPPLTPQLHVPHPLQPSPHCIMIRVPQLSGGAWWVWASAPVQGRARWALE